MTESKDDKGFVFEPALQGISLKRFRMRYSTFDDCYYLHWDNPVCRPLAKKYGLGSGMFRSSGVERITEGEQEQLAYLACKEGANGVCLEWVFDFSSCGLVVHKLALRVRCSYGNQDSLSLTVQGDNNITVTPQIGDQHTNLNCLAGCSRVSILLEGTTDDSLRILPTFETDECPFDLIADLMCPRKDDDIYAGELLLGIKYTSEDGSGSELLTTPTNPRDDESGGHLQVHIVEGAGIVDEVTHRPFNTFCKCDFLPTTNKQGSKQTSPKHNAYPTWTQQFDFQGLSKQDIISGGLEVILYDHHTFSSDPNIGGLRMCIPHKKLHPLNDTPLSVDSSPCASRGSSPILGDSPYHSDGSFSPVPGFVLNETPRSTGSKLPTSLSLHTVQSLLKPTRSSTPDIRNAHTLSPDQIRRSSSSANVAKSKFRLSGSHLINFFSSPKSSPVARRKFLSQHNYNMESDYVHWWMEDTPLPEVRHWKEVVEKNGEWVYFWHLIRPKLKSAI